MTDTQTRKLNAAEVGLEYVDTNNAVWSASAAYQTQRNNLETHIDTIEDLEEAQDADITGHTTAKKAAKEAMCLQALIITKPLTVFAKVSGNDVLKAEVDFELTDLTHVKNADSQQRCQLIHNRANTHLAALTAGGFQVDAAGIALLQTRITAFDKAQPTHDAAESTRQTITEAMKKEFTEMDKTIEMILELSDAYRITHAAFASGVKKAFEIDDIGKRKVSIEMRYTDADTEVFLRKVEAKLVETGMVKRSSKVGRVAFLSLGSGNFSVESKLPGYADALQKNIAATDGKIMKVAVKMKKTDVKPPPPRTAP